MTKHEQRALLAFSHVTMRLGSSGKRFIRDLNWRLGQDETFKLTYRQARYLWLLVDMYRRQIPDKDLRGYGAHVKLTNELPPDIYLEGDLADPIVPKPKPPRPYQIKPGKPTRYEIEMKRGGGKLAL